MLHENNKMFNGTLEVYQYEKLHIYVDQVAKPVHARPYSVPYVQVPLRRVPQQQSEWASPTFIVPIKDGWVH